MFDTDDEEYSKPPKVSEQAKQTAIGVFLGMTAWSLLCAAMYLIAWLLR